MHGETEQDGLAGRRTCCGRCLATAPLQKTTEGGSAVCLSSRLWEEGNPIRHPRPLRACHACAYTAGRGTPVPFDWLSCALSHGGASSCRSRTLHPCRGLRDVRHFVRLLRYLAPAPRGDGVVKERGPARIGSGVCVRHPQVSLEDLAHHINSQVAGRQRQRGMRGVIDGDGPD